MASPTWCPLRFEEFDEGICMSGCAWNVGGRCAVALLAMRECHSDATGATLRSDCNDSATSTHENDNWRSDCI